MWRVGIEPFGKMVFHGTCVANRNRCPDVAFCDFLQSTVEERADLFASALDVFSIGGNQHKIFDDIAGGVPIGAQYLKARLSDVIGGADISAVLEQYLRGLRISHKCGRY